MGIIKMNQVSLFIMPNGKVSGVGTGLSPLSLDRHGLTGKTDNTIPGRGQDYGYDVYGRIRVKTTFQETPGGLLTATIEFDKNSNLDFVEERARDQGEFGVWEYSIPCGRRDNPYAWLTGGRLDYHGRATVTSSSDGDAPGREGQAETVVSSAEITWEYTIKLTPLEIASVTPEDAANQDDLADIIGLKEPLVAGCAPGYEGPDQHLFIMGEAPAGGASVFFSENGGGTWTEMTNKPFAANEHISSGAVLMTTGSAFRLIAARLTTDASEAAEIAYADPVFGNVAAATWTNADVGSTNGDVITVMRWLFYDRAYAAVGAVGSEGEVWTSGDQGETWTEDYTGTTVINQFVKGYGQDCEDVYAIGASNLILREQNKSGTFEALVGPSGGGTFYSMAIANDGLIFAGNAQSIYVSVNGALNAGGWTALKDFGTNKTVVDIFLKRGDSNHIYCVVDDTSGSANGEFWHSNDGGNSWTQVTALTNLGYNRGYESTEDDNLYLIAGDVDASTYGAVHRLTPSVSGC